MSVARRTTWYAVGTGTTFAASFASLPIATLVLEPADYGVFALATAVMGIGGMLAVSAVTIVFAQHIRQSAQENRSGLLSTGLAVTLAISLVVGGLVVALINSFPSWFADTWHITRAIGVLSLVAMVSSAVWSTFGQIMILDGRARIHAAASVSAAAGSLAALGVSLFVLELHLLSLFVSQAAGGTIGVLVAGWRYRRELSPRLDRATGWEIMRIIPSTVLTHGMNALHQVFERSLITGTSGLSQLGLYSHSQVYGRVMNQGVKTLGNSIWPTTLEEARDKVTTFPQTCRVWKMGHLLLLAGALVFVSFSDLIVSGLTHGKFAPAATLAAFWMVAVMIQNAGTLQIGYLYANGMGARVLRINATAAAVGILLLFFLVPLAGIYGAFGAMLAQLILRRAMLRIACLGRNIPPLDLRFYAGAVLIGGISGTKYLWGLGYIELLGLSGVAFAVWLMLDRRTVSEASAVIATILFPAGRRQLMHNPYSKTGHQGAPENPTVTKAPPN